MSVGLLVNLYSSDISNSSDSRDSSDSSESNDISDSSDSSNSSIFSPQESVFLFKKNTHTQKKHFFKIKNLFKKFSFPLVCW